MPYRHGAAVAALLACSLSLGCSSAYIPRPGPRLSMVIDDGKIAYVRDGKKFEGGYFGGDIEEAVQGNAKAEEYAREYKRGTVTGFALLMVAVAGAIGGLALEDTELAQQPPNSQSVPVPGLLVLGVAVIADIAGVVVISSALPHLYDAINAYNDGVTGPAAGPAGAAPGRVHAPSFPTSGP